PPPSPPPSPPPPSLPPPSPPPHIVVWLNGTAGDGPFPYYGDEHQNLTVWQGIAYTITYAGQHQLYAGDIAYWVPHVHPNHDQDHTHGGGRRRGRAHRAAPRARR
ncbi:MAG TPA: hypothetical protein DEQ58_05665, partial [Alcanivorax sp.]|nr:hypothetical protein [Alcanivorax sp.]